MRFDFNDEQGEIKGTAKQFIASRFKPDKVRELAEAGTYDDALWTEVSELGWPGIAIARGVRRPGPRHGRAGRALRGARLRLRAAAVPLQRRRRARDRGAPAPTSRRPRYLPGHRLGRGPRRRRRLRDRPIDGEGADVRSSSSATTGATDRPACRGRARAARPDRLDPPLLEAGRRRRRGAGRRRRGRHATGCSSRSRPSSSGSASGRWRWPSSTPRSGSSSSARSAPTRASPTPARRCSTTSRRPAR